MARLPWYGRASGVRPTQVAGPVEVDAYVQVIARILSSIERHLHAIVAVDPKVRPALDAVVSLVVLCSDRLVWPDLTAVVSAASKARAPHADHDVPAAWVSDLGLPRAQRALHARHTEHRDLWRLVVREQDAVRRILLAVLAYLECHGTKTVQTR